MGNTSGCGRNGGEFKFAEKIVVFGQRPFTLKDLDQNSGLIVRGSGEAIDITLAQLRIRMHGDVHLALLRRDDRVTGNQLGEDTTSSLDTERKWTNINEEDISCSLGSGEDATLNSSTIGHSLVRVDTFRRFFAKELLE